MRTVDPDVKLAAAGDMEAFERIYRQHHGRVFALCVRMTRNVAQAEDLTQDVFIQLFRKLKTFRGEASFTTWLHKLTVNQVLMHFRKPGLKTERQMDEEISASLQTARGTANPRRMAVVDRISLREVIRQLPKGYRTVFILHDVAGYEHEEIGRMLGCAIGTSKSQLHKAREKLRSLLDRHTKPQQPNRYARVSLTPGIQSQLA